jgi:DNA repair protein RecO (recombination protein O)
MAVHYRTKSFVIKKAHRGEANELLTLYTEKFGKVKVLSRGSRKIASKLRAHAQLFYFSEVEFIQGKRHKTLTDALVVDSLAEARRDLNKMIVMRQIAELLEDLIHGEEADRQIWLLLEEIFKNLNCCPPAKLSLARHYFFWNLAAILGYQPDLKNNSLDGERLNEDIAKILKIILRRNWGLLVKLKITIGHQKLLSVVSGGYLDKISNKN